MNINKYTPILLAAFLVANACTSKIKESNPSITKEVVSTKSKNLTGKRFVRDRNLDEKVNENPELSNPGSINFKSESEVSYFAPGSDMGISGTYQIIGDKVILESKFYSKKNVFTLIDENTLKDESGRIYKAK